MTIKDRNTTVAELYLYGIVPKCQLGGGGLGIKLIDYLQKKYTTIVTSVDDSIACFFEKLGFKNVLKGT